MSDMQSLITVKSDCCLLASALGLIFLTLATPGLAADRYVSLSGLHEYPFTTWAKAANDLQSAIVAAAPGDRILVDSGTYQGSGNRNIDLLGKTLNLSSVYGSGVTLLDCGGQAGFILNGTGIVVRGFTIEGAYSNGLRCAAGSQSLVEDCQIQNCVPAKNSSQTTSTRAFDGDGNLVYQNIETTWPDLSRGGGAYCVDAEVEFRGCTFKDNSSSGAGGSLFATNSQIRMTDCSILQSHTLVPVVESNSGDFAFDGDGNLVFSESRTNRVFAYAGGGGGLFLAASSIVASNCLLMGNSSVLRGGAISLVAKSTGSFVQCHFTGNKALGRFASDSVVGNYAYSDGDLVFSEFISVSTNVLGLAGGGAYSSESTLQFNHCLISDNAAEGDGGGLALAAGSICIISNSFINDNRAGTDGYLVYTTIMNPVFSGAGNLIFREIHKRILNSVSGGALAADSGHVSLYGSRVFANMAGSGAGFALRNGATLEVQASRYSQNTSLVERVDFIAENRAYDGSGILVFFGTTTEMTGVYGEASALLLAASTASLTQAQFDRNQGGGVSGAVISASTASFVAMTNVVVRQNLASYATNTSLIHLRASGLSGMNCSLVFNEPVTNEMVAEDGAHYEWVNSIVQSYAKAPDLAMAFSASHSCLVDPQLSGINLTFANPAVRLDGRLLAGSPCIDAGTAVGAPGMDLDGEARWDDPLLTNVSSFVDIGADEWVDADSDAMADFWEVENYGSTNVVQGVEDDDDDGLGVLGEYEHNTNPFLSDTDGDLMPDGWEVANSLSALSRNGEDDADADTFKNIDEFVALTDPRNPLSYFQVETIGLAEGVGMSVEWWGRSNRIYCVWQSDDLATWSNVYQVAGIESAQTFTNQGSASGLQHYRITVARP